MSGLGDVGTRVVCDVVERANNTLNSLNLAWFRISGIRLGDRFVLDSNWDCGSASRLEDVEFLDELVDVLILMKLD